MIGSTRAGSMDGCEAILEHLSPFRQRLESRATEQAWYELQQPQYRYVQMMDRPKIIYPDIAKSCRFTIDRSGCLCKDTTFALPVEDFALLV
jgi:hypothetical protein